MSAASSRYFRIVTSRAQFTPGSTHPSPASRKAILNPPQPVSTSQVWTDEGQRGRVVEPPDAYKPAEDQQSQSGPALTKQSTCVSSPLAPQLVDALIISACKACNNCECAFRFDETAFSKSLVSFLGAANRFWTHYAGSLWEFIVLPFSSRVTTFSSHFVHVLDT